MVLRMDLTNRNQGLYTNLESSSTLKKTSDLLDTLQKELSLNRAIPAKLDDVPSIKVEIGVSGAKNLPCRRKKKSKFQKTKNKNSKREDNVKPSTYVTFKSMPGKPVHLTNVCPKNTSPQWNYKCVVDLPLDLFICDKKQLIFNVWNKCRNTILQPNMQNDLILGFCAVDVGVLRAGSPTIQGWFDIVDFSGKPIGQIHLSISPVENVQKYKYYGPYNNSTGVNSTSANLIDNGNELFTKTLKRKFSELDEITERLRARLSEVVQEDSDDLNDVLMDQFERDINNSDASDDLSLLNFDEEARKFNVEKSDVKNDTNGGEYDGKTYRIVLEDTRPGKIQNSTELSMASGNTSSNDLLVKDRGHIDSLLDKLNLFALDCNNSLTPKTTSNPTVSSNIERLCNELVTQNGNLQSRLSVDTSNSNASTDNKPSLLEN